MPVPAAGLCSSWTTLGHPQRPGSNPGSSEMGENPRLSLTGPAVLHAILRASTLASVKILRFEILILFLWKHKLAFLIGKTKSHPGSFPTVKLAASPQSTPEAGGEAILIRMLPQVAFPNLPFFSPLVQRLPDPQLCRRPPSSPSKPPRDKLL